MWGNKKPELQEGWGFGGRTENAAKAAPAPWEGNTAMSTDAMKLGATSDRAAARLGASLQVKGEISGDEDLQIDGTVEGLVNLQDRKLTIGAAAKVTADIAAREVIVYGSVKGNLPARDRIEIKKNGSVVGDLTTHRIMIDDGAYFKGAIEIEKSSESAKSHEKSAFARPAAASPG